MPECDFVDIIVDILEQFMPKFISIYRMDEMLGRPWNSDTLLNHINNIAGKGKLMVEEEALKQHNVAAKQLRQHKKHVQYEEIQV